MVSSVAALDPERAMLDDRCSSWAVQSGLADFAVKKKSTYTNAFFDNAMMTENLDLIYVVRDFGEVVWGKTVDSRANEPINIEAFPASF